MNPKFETRTFLPVLKKNLKLQRHHFCKKLTCDIQDKPTIYERAHTIAMKISFLRLRRCGHSSIIAVTNPSMVQNCESRPISRIMKKNKHDHNGEPGSCSTAEGYAKKARPGPEAATSATGFCCSCAINPTTENITKPANILVLELTVHTISASLKINVSLVIIFRTKRNYKYVLVDVISEFVVASQRN